MIGIGSATQEIWLRQMLFNLKHIQEVPTKICCANKSPIILTKNPVFSLKKKKKKHINIKFVYIQELVKNKKIMLNFYFSENHVAKFYKSIKMKTLLKLKKMIGMIKFEKFCLMEAI